MLSPIQGVPVNERGDPRRADDAAAEIADVRPSQTLQSQWRAEEAASAARATLLESASVSLRLKWLLTGVILPILCFIIAGTSSGNVVARAPWQSGEPEDYVAMLMAWPGFAPLLPLVACSMIGLACWCWRPGLGRHFVVRLSLYTGVVLSVQFLIFTLITTGPVTIIAAAFFFPGLALAVFLVNRLILSWRRYSIRYLLILTVVVAVIIAGTGVLGGWEAIASAPVAVYMVAIVSTPVACPITYARASYRVSRRPDRLPLSVSIFSVALITWAAAWFASWKFAIEIMLIEYANLPTTDPRCYIATAAACGHRRLVGSQWIGPVPINTQLKRMKFLEFAIASASPAGHRRLRRVYDRIGPPLANLCRQSAWFADLTYVGLKPIEWAVMVLQRILGVPRASVDRLYAVPPFAAKM